MSSQQNPLYMISMYIGLVFGIFYVYSTFPVMALVVIAGTVVFLTYRMITHKSRQGALNNPTKAKLQNLSQKNIVQYGPWIKDNVRGHNAIIEAVLNQLQQNL